MKKFILSLGLVAMMLNLTNCAQYEDVNPTVEPQGDFELYAPISRTANDGLNTVWKAGDNLTVIHAVTDATTYKNDGEFKLESAETGRFLGTLNGTLDAEEEYDWYATYPYSSYIATPTSTNGYQYIGGRSDEKQTQTGNNSMTHIAGKNYPLVGKAYAVPAGTAPSIKMQHVSSLVEFEVVNKLNEAITISEIQFTAPESLVGTFYVNFADIENISCSNATYTANTATLAVANGSAIAAGSSAKFYMGVKPFTAAAGKELSIVVSASSDTGLGTHEKKIKLTSDVKFTAGKIKNVKVNYDTAIEVAEAETWQLIQSVDEITTGTYVIVAKQKGGAAIAYCPSKTSTSAAPNQVVTTLFDLTTASFESNAVPEDARWSFTGDASGLTIKNTSDNYLYNIANNNNGVRVGSTSDSWVITAAKNGAFNLKDVNQGRYLTLYGTTNWRCYTSPYTFGNTDQNSECYLYKLNDGVVVLTPSLTITSETSISGISHEGGSATIEYTVSNPVDGVSATATSSEDWVTITPAEGAFNLAIAANDGAMRTATITVAYEGAVSRTVSVVQLAKPADVVEGEPITGTISFASTAQRLSQTSDKQVWTNDGITFTNDKASSSTAVGNYSNPVRLYNGSSITITAEGKISKIVVTVNTGKSEYYTAFESDAKGVSGASVSRSNNVVTITFAEPVDEFKVAKLSKQTRFNTLSVTYIP